MEDDINNNNKRVSNGTSPETPLKRTKQDEEQTTSTTTTTVPQELVHQPTIGLQQQQPQQHGESTIPLVTEQTSTTSTTSSVGQPAALPGLVVHSKPMPMQTGTSTISTTSTTSTTSPTIATSISKSTTIAGSNIVSSPSSDQQQQQQQQQQQHHQTSVVLTSNFQLPPSNCTWFKMSEIHDIERLQMSEFFNGRTPSKTPEVYKEYRDFMINTYQQNPHQYLTFTAVRRNLTGDSGAMLRLHSFLDHWGLINFFVNPEGGTCIPPPKPQQPQHQQQQQQPTRIQSPSESKPTESPSTSDNTSSSILSPNKPSSTSTSTTTTTANNATSTSTSSSSTTLTISKSTNGTSLDLRNNIYGQPQAPPKIIEQTVNTEPPEEWTDQETLLLLEGIDIYGDSWADVAEHVGTKTKEQCLLHFLRLPIEDSYLEDNLSNPNKRATSGSGAADQYWSDSNVIQSLLAFLSKSVSPNVANAASKAAMEALVKEVGNDQTLANLGTLAATSLAATSIKAKATSKNEEKEIQSLILKIINLQTKKLEIKLKYYSDLEDCLDRDRLNLEKQRQSLFAERLSLLKANLTNQTPIPIVPVPNNHNVVLENNGNHTSDNMSIN
ncbi:myb domain-containing protein [Cavenderia fasciculata]|uniref:Myb domain-containing protein n=1 Tax=Cavenderia fasciculata TaxID=261658 RepID=F4QCD9_CACFS|nr:myb domain-containing protein [Cavenderia fasciculata]EGG13574.1 myb domain-containing protein [Cavenderia fasciculata]|eukprot:XP_004350278.1 myb domain-containing protein [Cavenderia fasciculata]